MFKGLCRPFLFGENKAVPEGKRLEGKVMSRLSLILYVSLVG
jgi:hypothetical protein